MRQACLAVVIAFLMMSGCSKSGSGGAGSEAEARQYFDAAMKQWMAGEKNDISSEATYFSIKSIPQSYQVIGVVPVEVDRLAVNEEIGRRMEEQDKAKKNGGGGDGNPSKSEPLSTTLKFNVSLTMKSEAGTPLEKLGAFRLTWNPNTQKWMVRAHLD